MKPLEKAVVVPLTDAQLAATVKEVMRNSRMTREEAIEFVHESRAGECWQNTKYTVLKRSYTDGSVHLSIRRNDRAAARDWREFQQIKNQLLGSEEEAVEIYPAESRVVDAANQYHLWSVPGKRIPLGFEVGLKVDNSAPSIGAVQRSRKCEP